MKKSSHRYEFSTFILYLNLLPKSSQILCPNKFISLLNVSLKKTFLKSLYEMEFPIAFFPKHLQNFCVLLVPALKNKLWNQLLNFPLNYLSFASVNLVSKMLKNARFLTIFCITFFFLTSLDWCWKMHQDRWTFFTTLSEGTKLEQTKSRVRLKTKFKAFMGPFFFFFFFKIRLINKTPRLEIGMHSYIWIFPTW